MQRWGSEVRQSVDIVVVYRELIASDMSEPELAARIATLTPESERKQMVRHFMTPPTVFGIEGSRNTIVDQLTPILRSARLPIPEAGDEDVIGGWRLIHNSLRRAKRLASSYQLTQQEIEEGPCLFIGKDCEKLQEAIPSLTRFVEDSELVAMVKRSSEAYDDTSDACAEALRILCKSMLSAKNESPAAVRRREVWDSEEDPTFRAIRIAQFDAKEKEKQYVRSKKWRP